MLISEEYKQLNHQLHIEKESYGITGSKYAPRVAELVRQLKVETLLDYGCGKKTLAKALDNPQMNCPRVQIINHDPCVPGLEYKAPCELVTCTDVLEHIEPDMILNVLDDIAAMTQKAAFLAITTTPARKNLPDGRNAHLIQQPPEWWLPLIMERWRLVFFQVLGSEFIVIGGAK